MVEEWREVPNFPGYEVSKEGQVRSPYFDRLIGGFPGNRYGHSNVCLRKDKKSYWRRVHRLVLEAFVGPCPPGLEACHNNGDPSDNRLSNLRWDTHAANEQDKRQHGTYTSSRHHQRKLSDEDIGEIRLLVNFNSQRRVARWYEVAPSTISRVVNGVTHAKG